MQRNKFVIIGLGAVGQELLRRIAKEYELLCIDFEPEKEEIAKDIRPDISVIIGDATSRLVLEKAEVNDADGVIITTNKEDVNIEVARILKEHFSPQRVISVGITSAGSETLESLGVEAENIFTASAIGIRNRLAQKSRAAHAIGLGKNEILEVEVHPNSRLANKPIGIIAPIEWKMGIIYRADNIIVPKRNTILKPYDRVVILGQPAVLKNVSDILTFNFQHFPLEYGSTGIAYLTGEEKAPFFDELDYLFSAFPLKKLVCLFSKKAFRNSPQIESFVNRENLVNREIIQTARGPLEAILQAASELNNEQGLIAVSKDAFIDSFHPLFFDYRKKEFFQRLSKQAACPILISQGTFPYEQVLVPGVEGLKMQSVLEISLEIALSLHNAVTALLIKPAQYISTDEDFKVFEERKKLVSEAGLMYKVSVKTEILEGNPVKIMNQSSKDFNLIIVDTEGLKVKRLLSFLDPDIIWHIIKGSAASVLLIPPVAESL